MPLANWGAIAQQLVSFVFVRCKDTVFVRIIKLIRSIYGFISVRIIKLYSLIFEKCILLYSIFSFHHILYFHSVTFYQVYRKMLASEPLLDAGSLKDDFPLLGDSRGGGRGGGRGVGGESAGASASSATERIIHSCNFISINRRRFVTLWS